MKNDGQTRCETLKMTYIRITKISWRTEEKKNRWANGERSSGIKTSHKMLW